MIQGYTTIDTTNFNFTHQKSVYRGKVRDVYHLSGDILVMIATDRISVFDVILPKLIPYKGQILNSMAYSNLKDTASLVPNWLLSSPHPQVMIGWFCHPYKVEIIVRAYLAGHAWRLYQKGMREICGIPLPEGLKENDKLPHPIITPSTKANQGTHDEDISKEDILKKGLLTEKEWSQIENYALCLFEKGTKAASHQGLILVDTKYEFGKHPASGEILLIDEVHTPDSSRYFYTDTYKKNQMERLPQKQLSKEFVRSWCIEKGFQGLEGQLIPQLPDDFVMEISDRYRELYEKMIGKKFIPAINNLEKIQQGVDTALSHL